MTSTQMNAGVFSSAADDWTTPDDLFARLDSEFHFTLDPCAYPETAKCDRYFTKVEDGLSQNWTGRVFMNPPYGRGIDRWVKKAFDAAQTTADVVVALVPARTCSKWWHDYCMSADEVRLIKGRLSFGGQNPAKGHNAPFPSAVVVFRGQPRVPQLRSIERDASAPPEGTPA